MSDTMFTKSTQTFTFAYVCVRICWYGFMDACVHLAPRCCLCDIRVVKAVPERLVVKAVPERLVVKAVPERLLAALRCLAQACCRASK